MIFTTSSIILFCGGSQGFKMYFIYTLYILKRIKIRDNTKAKLKELIESD